MNEIDFETSRAVISFITGGVMFKYPNLKLILAHSGGTLPVLAGRMKDRYPADKNQYIPNGTQISSTMTKPNSTCHGSGQPIAAFERMRRG